MIHPINDWLLVKRLTVASLEKITKIDSPFFYGTIIMHGGKTRNRSISQYTPCLFKKNSQFKYGLYHFFRESDVLMVFHKGMWRPVGRTVLVERETDEEKVNGIIIPACYPMKDQTLISVIRRIGVINGKDASSVLHIGDRIKVLKWDITIEDLSVVEKSISKPCAIVPIKLLDYRIEKYER